MRKIKYSVLMFVSLAFVSCNDSQSNENSNDSKEVKTTKEKNNGDEGAVLNVAYYVQDSIATSFNYYKRVDEELKAKAKRFEGQLKARYDNYRAYEDKIRKRMDAGEITGYQLDEIQAEAMQKQQSIANFEQQRGAELQKENMEYMRAILSKISEAGKEFCEERNVDILFSYEKGAQITYISNAFDVTEEFMTFLNERENEIMSGVEEQLEEGVDTESGLNF